ncbi:MAG: amidohydrolase family protein [Planctomycetaceae bacterium]|nr:amidohydrolase family protein [Planctomycetaceae bacterium]
MEGVKPMIIDAHQHFWKLDLPFDYAWLHEPQHEPICQNFLPETLKPHLRNTGVQKTVFVQTQHNVEENRWVLGMARQHDFIAGVVGWVDLASADCEKQLEEFKDNPKFVGIRHITQGEPDENFIVRPDVIRGLKTLEKHGVPFDLLFFVQHLRHAPTLAAQLPNLRMVVDHLSKPKIKAGDIDDWRKDIQAAAACENIYCKLSGMVTEADWSMWKPADLKPYVETALEAFGPERCMFGSDWPVCELAATYEEVYEALVTCLGALSETEKARILGGTATEFYDLQL